MRQLLIITSAALAACAQAEQVTETTEEIEASISSPGGAAGLNDVDSRIASNQALQGESRWFARATVQGPWAGYGPPTSEAAFSVRCEAERLVFNTTEMPPSGAGPTEMQLAAVGLNQSLTAQASEEGLPNTEASVAATTEWLGRLESASGDLTVTVGESNPLVVPIGEPLTSLISDCRS
ncbi:MAG: hypothetical protein ACR2JJ_02380 [Sphingomicrobium sp.]